jgi:hypothetical protein
MKTDIEFNMAMVKHYRKTNISKLLELLKMSDTEVLKGRIDIFCNNLVEEQYIRTNTEYSTVMRIEPAIYDIFILSNKEQIKIINDPAKTYYLSKARYNLVKDEEDGMFRLPDDLYFDMIRNNINLFEMFNMTEEYSTFG